MLNKEKIKSAFGNAAHSYDNNAYVQKIASDKLISLTKNLPLPSHICEIGCGTGYLTTRLFSQYQRVPYLATDISEHMIEYCKNTHLNQNNGMLHFKVEDGEKINFDFLPEWIVSNFTFQWFEKQVETIRNLYNHSQFLIFTTLLTGTFKEWKEICRNFGLSDKVLCFLDENEFLSQIKLLNPQYISMETEKEFYSNPLSFLRRLRNIGAYETRNNTEINIKAMRKVIGIKDPLEISYRIAYCVLKNENFHHRS